MDQRPQLLRNLPMPRSLVWQDFHLSTWVPDIGAELLFTYDEKDCLCIKNIYRDILGMYDLSSFFVCRTFWRQQSHPPAPYCNLFKTVVLTCELLEEFSHDRLLTEVRTKFTSSLLDRWARTFRKHPYTVFLFKTSNNINSYYTKKTNEKRMINNG